MQRRQKIIVAVAVLAVGAALALEFRRGKTSGESPTPNTPSQNDASTATTGPRDSTTASNQRTTFDGRIEPNATDLSGGKSLSALERTGSIIDTAHPDENAPPGAGGSMAPMIDLNAPDQTHKIVDGDTLQKLAQRYLGSADRYADLYQYNRDVLKNPEVLPIGVELRIPPKYILPPTGSIDGSALPAAQGNASPGNSAGAQSTATPAMPPLVNVPRTAPASPASAQRPKPRTYTVQFGDNLVDIARKLYGDGRRYQDLFEANRNQLRTPTDLKAGMVLAVP